MKESPVRNVPARLAALSVAAMGAFVLGGCGGGGGDDAAGAGALKIIAPESLEQVKMNFFNAFTMECYRLSGVAGMEYGACKYDRLKQTFRIEYVSGGENLGITVQLPALMTDVAYEYQRTGTDTGRVIFTFANSQKYPVDEATKTNANVSANDMFWGGWNGVAVNLIVDILFTDQGGFIGTTSTRIRSGYAASSVWTQPDGPAVNTEAAFDFDSPDVTYALVTGGKVPTAYNPYNTLGNNPVSSVLWETLQARIVDFAGTDGVSRRVAHQSTGGAGPLIPGVEDIEESGTILVDCAAEGVAGVGGTYSYSRIGGDIAKFAISYPRPGGALTLIYTMDFESFNSGTYFDSFGVSGTFQEEVFLPN